MRDEWVDKLRVFDEWGRRVPYRKWKKLLREAVDEDDFMSLKWHFKWCSLSLVYDNITSTVVLDVAIRYHREHGKRWTDSFESVAKSLRVDFLRVFFDHIPLERITREDCRSVERFVRNVITRGHVDVMKFLLEEGLDVNFVVYKETMLSLACAVEKVDIIDLLLEAGAQVNFPESEEPSHIPLFRAVVSNDVTILDRLILYGVDLTFTTKIHGFNAWRTAVRDCNGVNPYTEERLPIFQRLADLRIPVDSLTLHTVYERNFETPIEEKIRDIIITAPRIVYGERHWYDNPEWVAKKRR